MKFKGKRLFGRKLIRKNDLCRHICTQVENLGEVVVHVFTKIPMWVQGFWEKLPEGFPFIGFYCIFIKKFFEIWLGPTYLPSLFPPPPAVSSYVSRVQCYQRFAMLKSMVCLQLFDLLCSINFLRKFYFLRKS